ncbi:hypothetical protein F5146DRAFT_1129178 [Armillaria mellea]|nr:hypothetical protein F5146DRAFT_1129178 [Armillaria mellea]
MGSQTTNSQPADPYSSVQLASQLAQTANLAFPATPVGSGGYPLISPFSLPFTRQPSLPMNFPENWLLPGALNFNLPPSSDSPSDTPPIPLSLMHAYDANTNNMQTSLPDSCPKRPSLIGETQEATDIATNIEAPRYSVEVDRRVGLANEPSQQIPDLSSDGPTLPEQENRNLGNCQQAEPVCSSVKQSSHVSQTQVGTSGDNNKAKKRKPSGTEIPCERAL